MSTETTLCNTVSLPVFQDVNMGMTVTSISTVVYSWHRVRSSSVLLHTTQAGQSVTHCDSTVPTVVPIKGNNVAVIMV